MPIRLTHTPTTCSVSHRTAGKGRRSRIEESIRLISDCSEVRTGVRFISYIEHREGRIDGDQKETKISTARQEAADETTVPIRFMQTPTICSGSHRTAGKGSRSRIEESIRLISDCSEVRTGVRFMSYIEHREGRIDGDQKKNIKIHGQTGSC